MCAHLLKYSAISPSENTSLCIFLISPRCMLKLEESIDIFFKIFRRMLQLARTICIFLTSPRHLLKIRRELEYILTNIRLMS